MHYSCITVTAINIISYLHYNLLHKTAGLALNFNLFKIFLQFVFGKNDNPPFTAQ